MVFRRGKYSGITRRESSTYKSWFSCDNRHYVGHCCTLAKSRQGRYKARRIGRGMIAFPLKTMGRTRYLQTTFRNLCPLAPPYPENIRKMFSFIRSAVRPLVSRQIFENIFRSFVCSVVPGTAYFTEAPRPAHFPPQSTPDELALIPRLTSAEGTHKRSRQLRAARSHSTLSHVAHPRTQMLRSTRPRTSQRLRFFADRHHNQHFERDRHGDQPVISERAYFIQAINHFKGIPGRFLGLVLLELLVLVRRTKRWGA